MRKGTVEFPKYGLHQTKILPLLFFIASVGSGDNQLSFSDAGELCVKYA